MLYELIIAAALLSFLLNLILNLRSLKVPSSDSPAPREAPLISILIPARNEESNIRTCLDSLQKQDYPNFEVMVLDDNSSDETPRIVRELAAGDSRIQLIQGDPLPKGWAGKPFACYQLARRANGSWLLFTDADTIHQPEMLRSVLALALDLKLSLLSGFPRQLAKSLPQKIAIPVLYFVIMSWLPLWRLQHSRKSTRSLAIGQFLLFSTKEYWRVGGHEAVRSRILEDVWLGLEIKRHGGRYMAVDLSRVVNCHMYGSIRAMWEGFIKWIYSVTALSPAAILGLLVAGFIFFLAPFYLLWRELAAGARSDLLLIIAIQVVTIIFMRGLLDSHFKEPAISTVLHPVGFAFLFLAGVYGSARRAAGRGFYWKNRYYDRESGVQ